VTGVFVSTGLVLLLIFISLLNQILTLLATPLFYQWLLRRYYISMVGREYTGTYIVIANETGSSRWGSYHLIMKRLD